VGWPWTASCADNPGVQPQTPQVGREVGRGRSGVVYFDHDARGRPVVEKVFGGDTASKLVLYTLTGAPNPYAWCDDAVACAVQRRIILGHLVRYWFGDRLSLPFTDGMAWRDDPAAFALRTGYVEGRHAPLRLLVDEPEDADRDARPIRHLSRQVMRPLQHRLCEAGFDGLLWQAGLGNPVAANNFMLLPGPGRDGRPRWVCIDLESGVPALFPANPLTLLRFYLPKSFKHGRPLFDDTDTAKLDAYLAEHRDSIADALGAHAMGEIEAAAALLAGHQRAWKSLGRIERSIEAAAVRGRITPAQALRYRRQPWRWYGRLARVTAAKAADKLAGLPGQVAGRLRAVPWRAVLRGTLRMCISQTYRTRLARQLAAVRIRSYEQRGQLTPRAARVLRRDLFNDESAEYLTDFGVHLAIKPGIKFLEWVVVPALLGAGVVGPTVAALAIATGGMAGRTAYTLGRSAQAVSRGQPLPWVALVVGLLPMVGNLAYPAQLLWAAGHDHRLARFLIYDGFASLGRRLPVWGGTDTFTEHFFNRLPDRVLHLMPRRRSHRAAADTTPVAPAVERAA